VIARALAFIRFSHTVFALPFALGSMLVAARGFPSARLAGLIVLAMVFARSAAMTFNRLADWQLDQRNPRTADRHKLLPRSTAILLLILSSAGFLCSAAFINRLCFLLSPIALAIVFFYSITKRFTAFTHFFLGLALAISPIGAWLAVRAEFDFAPLVLAMAVLLWVAGFDLIYALQDREFDREAGLHSLAVRLGVPRSLAVAQGLHWAMLGMLGFFGCVANLSTLYYASLVLIAGALIYEHRSASRLDVAGINRAFFESNAVVGLLFLLGVAADQLPR
jgi:4-hydroxybenzoate polyprenyltransferase